MSNVRVRIAPSPTGLLHVGTVRTALFNYYFARQQGGKFIIRIEDTDPERSTREFEENIITGLKNLGLEADEDPYIGGPFAPYRQSERKSTYRPYLEQLLAEGKAYYCYCSKEELEAIHKEQVAKKQAPRYPGICRKLSVEELRAKSLELRDPVIRLRVPENVDVSFEDLIRGKVSQSSKELDDFIIARSLESPLYNFVVVVDDVLMEISHVIRGDDHIANTFKQILIYQALGVKLPQFAHLPLILNTDKTKLSKRKNKVSINDFLAEGYLPEAIINFLSLLGWNPGNDQEIMDKATAIKLFDLTKVQKGGAVFDMVKFQWINSQYIRKLSLNEFCDKAQPFLATYQSIPEKALLKALVLIQERCKKLGEIPDLLQPLFTKSAYDMGLLLGKSGTVEIVQKALAIAEHVVTTWSSEEGTLENRLAECESLKEAFAQEIASHGLKNGDVLWPTRVALSGQQFSPGAFEMIWFVGKSESLKRLTEAKQKLLS